jgi:YidC/Oxa1 family membrane protein insertase
VDRNLLLACALSFLVLVGWQSLFPAPQTPSENSSLQTEPLEATEVAAEDTVPGRSERTGDATTSTDADVAETAVEQLLSVQTPHYRTTLSSHGAAIVGWELKEFDSGRDHGKQPIQLLASADHVPARLTTPLVELGLGDLRSAAFRVDQVSPREFHFELSRSGVVIRKRYVFSEDDYSFRMQLEIENRSDRAIQPSFGTEWDVGAQTGPDFRELSLTALRAGESEDHLLSQLGVGGFFSGPTSEINLRGDVGWIGLKTPYFFGAVAPDHAASAVGVIRALEPGRLGRLVVAFEPVVVPAGTTALHEFKGYFGPKVEADLLAAGSNFASAVDFGWEWISPLTRFFVWLLHALHAIVPNYGVAIILITVLVRAATMPLTNRQMRSMERMRMLQPKQLELQQKYADDRQKQSEALMELYRREKVNPMGGCLPMLLQLPVFVGLYYALRSSIELRQAPFFGWIHDLSQPEQAFVLPVLDLPVRVLPLLMGASMVVQQKLTPTASMDPAQARMMLVLMPVMMTFMFYQFPSGLVLYWMVSNVLAISHQRWIGSRLQPARAA